MQGIVVLPFLIGCGRLNPGRTLLARVVFFVLLANLFLGTNAAFLFQKVARERMKRSELSSASEIKHHFAQELKSGRIGSAFTTAATMYFTRTQEKEYLQFKHQLDYVNELTRTSKHESAVFLAPESPLWKIPRKPKASPFLVASYTGLVVLNAIYSDGTVLRDGGGGNIGDVGDRLGYGLDRLKKEPRRDLAQCLAEARQRGFKKIIVIDNDVHVIYLSDGSS